MLPIILLVIGIVLIVRGVVLLIRDSRRCYEVYIVGGVIWIFVILCQWVMFFASNYGTISRMMAYYDFNYNVELEVVRKINRISAYPSSEAFTSIDVANMSQSSKASESLIALRESVLEYNKNFVGLNRIKQNKLLSLYVPAIPERLKIIELEL